MIAPDYRKMFPHIPGHKCAHREADNREWQIRGLFIQ